MKLEHHQIAALADTAWQERHYALACALYLRMPEPLNLGGEHDEHRKLRLRNYRIGIVEAEAAKDALEYYQDVKLARAHLHAALAKLPKYRRAAPLEEEVNAWEGRFEQLTRMRNIGSWAALEKVSLDILDRFPENHEAQSSRTLASDMLRLTRLLQTQSEYAEQARQFNEVAGSLKASTARADDLVNWLVGVSRLAHATKSLAQETPNLTARRREPALTIVNYDALVTPRLEELTRATERIHATLHAAFVTAMRGLLYRADFVAALYLLGEGEQTQKPLFPGIRAHYAALGLAPAISREDSESISSWLQQLDAALSEANILPAASHAQVSGENTPIELALRLCCSHAKNTHELMRSHLQSHSQARNWAAALSLAAAVSGVSAWVPGQELALYRSKRDQQAQARTRISKHISEGRYVELGRLLWDASFVDCLPVNEVERLRRETRLTVRRRATIAVVAGLLLALVALGYIVGATPH